MEIAHTSKRRKRKKKKVRCTPAKTRRPVKRAKGSSAEIEATAAARKKRKRKPVCKKKAKKKKKKAPVRPPSGLYPAAPTAPTTPPVPGPAAPVPPPPTPPAPPHVISSPIAVYSGNFGPAQAERLLWRAGFGPRPGQVRELVALGLEAAVLSLTRPVGVAPMDGPEPTDEDGASLSPYDRYDDDLLYWLDRMVRSRHQLVERLSLAFHDWFATSQAVVNSQRLMLDQTNVFRANGLGNFKTMVREITQDPAMILYLDQPANRRNEPNENYARELMELFTLGADRGAYTETDVRELARSLTGWRFTRTNELGAHDFRFDPNRWDTGTKTVFGKSGAFNWEDACRMVVEHPLHPSFFVRKLWSYFIPTPPDDATTAKLAAHYRNSGYEIRPVLEAILFSPQFYAGPRMVKPPIVFAAGLLRARNRAITKRNWGYVCSGAGQRVYYPPDVSGWDDKRWLNTTTMLGRWSLVVNALVGDVVPVTSPTYPAETADQAVAAARAFWGDPDLSDACVAELRTFASGAIAFSAASRLHAQRQNALRQLIVTSPDYQTS